MAHYIVALCRSRERRCLINSDIKSL